MRRSGWGVVAAAVVFGVGCKDEALPLDLSGDPTTLTIVSGNQQFGQVGTTLTNQLVVSLTDADGRPVPARQVSWSASGGSVLPGVDSTDNAGIASTRWTLPNAPGSYTVLATVAGVGAVSFSAQATGQGGVNPAGTLTFRYVDAGSYHACGITTAEQIYCWGYNGDGQLGFAPSAPEPLPTLLPELERFRLVSGGRYHTCGLTLSGEALCYGENKDNRLGLGAADTATYQTVQAGLSHTCAISLVRELFCWGNNHDGQLGLRDSTKNRVRIYNVEFEAVTVGGIHTCAVLVGGTGLCWGSGYEGQLGNNTNILFSPPDSIWLPVKLQTDPLVAPPHPDPDMPLPVGPFLAAGYAHTCGIGVNGTTYCWGLNERGQLGTGTTASSSVPMAIAGGPFVQITAGYAHSCGLTAAGAAFCWGDNRFGQLGDGTTTSHLAPVAVSGSLTFAYIRAGDLSTCAVTTAGVAYCWGDNEFGQLGNGGFTSSNIPVKVGRQP